MRNPFKRREKALTGDSGVVAAMEQGWSAYPLLGSGARQRIVEIYNAAQGAHYSWLYIKSPALRCVVDEITRNVGELDLRLYEEVSEQERQPDPEHPAALSMRYPSEVNTADNLVRGLFLDYLLFGNAYALLLPGQDDQIYLNRIPAYMVEIQGHSIFAIDNFRVWPQGAFNSLGAFSGGSGAFVNITPDQMLHWHGESPLDPRLGISPLDTLRGVIAEDAALQQATVELAKSGLQEPVWVSRPLEAPAWSNEARSGFEEDLRARLARANAGTPPVMEEGMEIKSFGVSPRDAELLDARKWAISQIAGAYGVPAGKVGLAPATQEDEDDFVREVLRPYTQNFACMLNQRLLVRVYDDTDHCFEFDLDDRLMGNSRLQALTSAAGVPILLRDEARAMINKPPVPGGDEPATPVNVNVGNPTDFASTPGANPAPPKPGNQVMPIQDANKPPQDGSYRQEDGQTPVPSNNRGKALMFPEDASQRLPQYHPSRAADMERQRRHIDSFQGVTQRFYNRLSKRLNEPQARKDWDKWTGELATDFTKQLHSVVQSEGDIYTLKLAGSNFNMAEVHNYLGAMAEGVASAVTDNLRKSIEDDGLDNALARAPQHVSSIGTSLGVRSTLWAREEAARQSGTFRGPDQDLGC